MIPFLVVFAPLLAGAAFTVDDFELAENGLPRENPWYSYQDSASGKATFLRSKTPGVGDTGHCAHLEVAFSGPTGYAGAVTPFSTASGPVDFSAYGGVRVRARTNAATFKIQLPTIATNAENNHFLGTLPADTTWRTFELPFSKLKQDWGTPQVWKPAEIIMLGILVQNPTKADIWLEVDDIEFYRPGEETIAPDTATFVSKCPKVNQVGYEPSDPKIAIATVPHTAAGDSFHVVAPDGSRVWGGIYGAEIDDIASSGETVVQGDFTAFQTTGNWRIETAGRFSAPFRIGAGVLSELYANALRTFRSIRCGAAIHDERIGMDHAPCHMQDTLRSDGGPSGDFTGGWHNAGDFGKWIPEAGLSTSIFLWLAELDRARSGRIPTGSEALLDEARWGLQWILKMQLADGAMLHKVDPEPDFTWGTPPDLDRMKRWASVQSKDSTTPSSVDAAVAVAVLTQGARVFAAFDPAFAARCAQAADRSWTWLAAHPGIAQNDRYYVDKDSRQEEFWALAERARSTASDSLRAASQTALGTLAFSEVNWNTPQLLGALSLRSDASAPAALRLAAANALTKVARGLRKKSVAAGYRVALESYEYWWESNENALHRGEALLYGFLASDDSSFLVASRAQLDYVLGQNPLDTSYVVGFGQKSIRRPYHWSTMDYGKPLPGWITGGPNHYAATLADVSYDAAQFDLVNTRRTPPAKSYLDLCTNSGSYASNEGETSEQAALVFLSGWFSGPGAWAAPSVSVASRIPSANPRRPGLRLEMHDGRPTLVWPTPAGRPVGGALGKRDASSRP